MKLKTVFKIIFVFGLLYYLGQKGFLSFEETARALKQWKSVAGGFLLLMSATILGIVRWQLLLKAQGIGLRLGRTARLALIGNFFNIALPGAVSGDFVKAIYVSKEAEGKAAHAFSSILFDRVAGVSALVLISAMAMVLSSGAAWSGKLVDALEVFVISAGVGVLFFYAYFYILKDHHDPVLHFLARIAHKHPKIASLKRAWEGLRIYRRHRMTVLWVLSISVIIHAFVISSCALFAGALGEGSLALPALFVVVPLGLLVTAIPVTPAGVGTGHAAFTFLFGLLGSAVGANVFNFFLISQIFFGSIGGLVYLRFKKEPGHELPMAQGVSSGA